MPLPLPLIESVSGVDKSGPAVDECWCKLVEKTFTLAEARLES
jgi:hypothetical protein